MRFLMHYYRTLQSTGLLPLTLQELQQHIMQHGSVAMGFIVYEDFLNFWSKAAPKAYMLHYPRQYTNKVGPRLTQVAMPSPSLAGTMQLIHYIH
jgi:uncharacterized protein Usg